MDWKKRLESSAGSANDELRLRHAYLLAEIGAKLGRKALEEIATAAQPDTILAWNRTFTERKVA